MLTRSRDQKLWCVSCDSCPDGIEIDRQEAPEITDLAEHIKAEGWTARRIDGGWDHFCPDCSKKGKTP